MQIFGERGDTGIIELRKEASSGFVRGKTDFFNVDAVDIGAVSNGFCKRLMDVFVDARCSVCNFVSLVKMSTQQAT